MSKLPKLNILVAWPYLKPDLIEMIRKNKKYIRLFVDSGAFTAWKKGQVYSVEEYMGFLDSIKDIAWRYFALDVIGEPEGTKKNLDIMLAKNYKPVPVFTRGESLSELKHLLDVSDVIALGGLVGTKGNTGFVKGILKHVDPRRTHWLGFTRVPFVKFYKPYSCDSSSWETGGRYGVFELYLGNGQFTRVNKKVVQKGLPLKVRDVIRSYGYTVNEFYKKENWVGGYSSSRCLGGASIVRYSLEIGEKYDVKHFMAATTPMAVDILLKAYHKEIES